MTSKLIELVKGFPGDLIKVPFHGGTLVLVAICPIFLPFLSFAIAMTARLGRGRAEGVELPPKQTKRISNFFD